MLDFSICSCLICLEFYSMSDALQQVNLPCGDDAQLLHLSTKDL